MRKSKIFSLSQNFTLYTVTDHFNRFTSQVVRSSVFKKEKWKFNSFGTTLAKPNKPDTEKKTTNTERDRQDVTNTERNTGNDKHRETQETTNTERNTGNDKHRERQTRRDKHREKQTRRDK